MVKISILTFLMTGMLLFGACSQKNITQSEPLRPAVEQDAGQADTGITQTSGNGTSTQVPSSAVQVTDEPSPSPQEKAFEFRDIHFDYDRYDIRPGSRAVLEDTAAWMLKNRDSAISIEGHCDERGTNDYNLALGDRRANSVKKFLTASGVNGERIRTVSYGEERPVCTEQDDACWQKNRRAHFVLN